MKWTRVNEAHNIMDRPFYYTEIIADPQNPDRVYNMATRLRVSIDGGRNFEHIAAIDCCAAGNTIHIDNHAFWINPADPRHLIIGNDGGIAISRDRGDTWRFVRNLPLAQFYHVAVDDSDPYHVYGGLQDNGSFRGPAEIREQSGIRNLHWQEVGFGDGFDTRPDPENDRAGYGQSQGGFLYRYDLDTGLQQIIRPAPHGEDVDLRFNWNAGLAQDPFDPATIYYGSQYVHKSTDRGRSWTVISPDLTSNDPEMQTFRTSGGLTYDVTAAENYTSIVAIAPSTLQRDVLWVGSDDGRVHVTQDGGTSWTRIDERARGVPDGAWVPMIAPSPHDAGTAFVVFDDHRRSDMNPYVYRVTDFGRRWESLVTDELEGYALSVLQDHQDADLLFLGTEFGLFFSTNGGGEWTRFKAGVPTVSVMDMAIQARENDLVLGTHGRSIYVIDDYSALRNLGAEDFEARLKLLSVSDGQRYAAGFRASTRFTGAGEFRGANEPYGAMFTFLASGDDLPHPDEDRERDRLIGKRKAESSGEDGDDSVKTPSKPPRITVRISDTDGKAIRTFKRPVHQGINRVTWGMQADGVRPQPGPNRRSADDDLPPGPQVPPGMYTITLTLGEEEVSATARVLPDPRLDISQEQYEAGFAAQQELMKLNEASVTALERIDHARSDVTTVGALIGKHPDAAEDEGLKDLKKQAGEIGKKLDELEKRFRNLPKTRGVVYSGDKVGSRIGMAMYFAASAAGAPSPTAEAYAGIARRTLDEALSAVNEFLEEDLAAFREAVSAAGIGLLTPTDPVSVKQ
ncbi:MAG: hypothetical protein GWM87_12705 [Xanthomonadales bacterium]|nr:hypothetical protein [Xanthomonadales bacterium]NIX13697.1 hypothetical protein [Xanthomonadales bacterium]